MTLAEYCNEANNLKITDAINRSVKYPENFEITGITANDNWITFDVYGLKSKSNAQVRISS